VPPAPLQSRTGRALKWAVSALLIAALGLGSWQLAETLIDRDNNSGGDPGTTQSNPENNDAPPVEKSKPVPIVTAQDYDPLGPDGSEKPQSIGNVYDDDPSSYWYTDWYASTDFGRLKKGVGVVLDLGKTQRVGKVDVSFLGGTTSAELRTADGSTVPTEPTGFDTVAQGSGTKVTLKPAKPVQARFLLVWLTKLPPSDGGHFRGKVSDIKVTS
ncbi:serine/threonine protein kinase, partial [Streptomyces rubiginosohelvolus]